MLLPLKWAVMSALALVVPTLMIDYYYYRKLFLAVVHIFYIYYIYYTTQPKHQIIIYGTPNVWEVCEKGNGVLGDM